MVVLEALKWPSRREMLWLVRGRMKIWNRAWLEQDFAMHFPTILNREVAQIWEKKHLQHAWHGNIIFCNHFKGSLISSPLLPHHTDPYLASHPFLTRTCTLITSCCTSLEGKQILSVKGAATAQVGTCCREGWYALPAKIKETKPLFHPICQISHPFTEWGFQQVPTIR